MVSMEKGGAEKAGKGSKMSKCTNEVSEVAHRSTVEWIGENDSGVENVESK